MKVPAFFVGYGIVKFALEEYAGSEYLSLQANGQCILARCEDEIEGSACAKFVSSSLLS